jgi:hypothetical protein
MRTLFVVAAAILSHTASAQAMYDINFQSADQAVSHNIDVVVPEPSSLSFLAPVCCALISFYFCRGKGRRAGTQDVHLRKQPAGGKCA